MKKIVKEPLFHFVCIGIILFILFGLVNNNNNNDDRNTIIIDDYDLQNIIASWEMQWKRQPTPVELKNLLEQNIKQEIFYQEALKMNLDHNDEIIKRRLAQKMQFLSKDLATIKEPSDQELKEFYLKNKEKYLTPYYYTFKQIVFSPDKRTNPKLNAEIALAKIKNGEIQNIDLEGDKIPFPHQFEEIADFELKKNLGNDFATVLETVEIGKWVGPIKSGFGQHLVMISNRIPPEDPEFSKIREDLIRDLKYANQNKLDEAIFTELKKQYQIDFDINTENFDQELLDFLKEQNG